MLSAEKFGGTDPKMAEVLYEYGAILVRVAQVSDVLIYVAA
jgi:hypothetical protein